MAFVNLPVMIHFSMFSILKEQTVLLFYCHGNHSLNAYPSIHLLNTNSVQGHIAPSYPQNTIGNYTALINKFHFENKDSNKHDNLVVDKDLLPLFPSLFR